MANRLQMNIIIIKISVANPLSIILKGSLPNSWQSHYKSTKCKKERGFAVINDCIDAIVAASEEKVITNKNLSSQEKYDIIIEMLID